MKGVKERGVMDDSRVLEWNNWKKGTAPHWDGEEQVWGKLENPIQYSNELFGIVYLEFWAEVGAWNINLRVLRYRFKIKCFELLRRKSLKVIFILTFLLWQLIVFVQRYLPKAWDCCFFIFLCLAQRQAPKNNHLINMWCLHKWAELYRGMSGVLELRDLGLNYASNAISLSMEAIWVLWASGFSSTKRGLTSISQDR